MDNLLIAEAAEEEYTDSLRWYAERSMRAAEGFEAAFAQALELIAAHPERYPLCDDRHRFFLLKRYPFQVSLIGEESGTGSLKEESDSHKRTCPAFLPLKLHRSRSIPTSARSPPRRGRSCGSKPARQASNSSACTGCWPRPRVFI